MILLKPRRRLRGIRLARSSVDVHGRRVGQSCSIGRANRLKDDPGIVGKLPELGIELPPHSSAAWFHDQRSPGPTRPGNRSPRCPWERGRMSGGCLVFLGSCSILRTNCTGFPSRVEGAARPSGRICACQFTSRSGVTATAMRTCLHTDALDTTSDLIPTAWLRRAVGAE